MAAIEVSDLSVSFGDLLVVDKVSFTVRDEEIVALIGPSGCGKSTLLRVIAGIIPALISAKVEGTVAVLGYPPDELGAGLLGMMFQESCLLPWRDALSNVGLSLEIMGNQRLPVCATDLLRRVGLGGFEKNRPAVLSGGMKQRVSLAATLIACPQVLLMDEPLANLDSITREQMWRLVEQLKSDGLIRTAALVTHSIDEAVALSDRVLVFSSRPARIVSEVIVPLPRPRVGETGEILSGCFPLANRIRTLVRNGGTQ